MIDHVLFADLPVREQDRAVRFYTERLGLRVARDDPYRGAWRWLELEIPGAATRILLTPASAERAEREGDSTPALVLAVEDVDAAYAAFAKMRPARRPPRSARRTGDTGREARGRVNGARRTSRAPATRAG